MQVTIRIFDAGLDPFHVDMGFTFGQLATAQVQGWPGGKATHDPVQQCTHKNQQGWKPETFLDGGQEADFFDGGGIITDQVITAFTQLPHQGKFPGLQVFDAAPGQVRRLRAGGPAKITFVDQGDVDPLGCQGCR